MEIKVVLDEGAKMPTKAHDIDAGFDLYTPFETRLYSEDCVTIDTGVHMQIPKGYCGLIVSKSGLYTKHGITSTGLIDSGYTGSIRVKLERYAPVEDSYVLEEGDKISQLVILPIPEVELVQTDTLEETERGNGGFGSTGR